VTFTDSGASYKFFLEPGTYTVCEALESGWAQIAPSAALPAGLTLADCTSHSGGGTVPLASKGYSFTLGPGVNLEGADFGNASSIIRGVKFEDLNGNGVHDPGESVVPGWPIYLVRDRSEFERAPTKPQPGPPVHATITVDRHTRRRPGAVGPFFTTTTGQRAKIVLMRGPQRAEAIFDVEPEFSLGCVPDITNDEELNGQRSGFGFYIPISDYWMPPAGVLASLFTKIGVSIDPPAYAPIIKAVRKRECVRDPNPANGAGAGVFNPGILVVQVEIGFVSLVDKVVDASTTTNASGEYAFELPPGTYTVCEALPPGWRQTFPLAGPNLVSCAGTNTDLAPQGHVVTLSDPGQIAPLPYDFGNVSDAQLWLGLKSSDDQGALFDVQVELLKNGGLVASGLRRCVTGLTRNPTSAQGIRVAWDTSPSSFAPTDVLALKVSTRIGTNPDDTQCAPERGSSHNSARGLRLYYDAASRPSHVDPPLTSGSNQVLYLDSNGTACPGGGAESSNVTDRTLSVTAPSGAAAKCKDSSAVTFSGGNPFKELGTWTLR
jgi:hypothetical protein